MNAGILRALYGEAGIAVTSSPVSQLQHVRKPGMKAEDTAAEQKDQNKGANGIHSINLKPLLSNEDLSNSKGGLSCALVAKEEVKSPIKSTAPAVPKKSATNGLSAKIFNAKTNDSKPLDRKEYIARMLAAKASKPATSVNSSLPLEASIVTAPKVAAQPVSMRDSTTRVLPAADLKAQDHSQQEFKEASGIMSHALKDDADAEAKRRAQTDLARQKIEALKSQQETRKVTSSILIPQNEPASSGKIHQAPVLPPIAVPVPPDPSRPSSYFSPISQKTPFNIPGLFMTAEPSQSVIPTDRGPTQPSEAPTQESQESSSASKTSQKRLLSMAAAPDKDPSVEIKSGAVVGGSSASIAGNRKRQKAADFLDSPSTRFKRPLGRQENSSVIIDLSDDEMVDASDVDSILIETTSGRAPTPKQSRLNDLVSDKQKSSQDLPPLHDSSSQRRTPAMTPPVGLMPNQARGLRTKEMEIESMNRRIAELEQRINAKKTTSRASTPRPSGSTTVSSPPDKLAQDKGEKSKVTAEPFADTNGDSSDDRRSRQVSLVTKEDAENVATERELHEVGMAKAEAENTLAAGIAQASAEEQLLQQDCSRSIEVEEYSKFGDEAKGLKRLQSQEIGQVQLDQEQQRQDRSEELRQIGKHPDIQERKHSHSPEEVRPSILAENRRMRRTAIEAGLPVLDATVEKTKQRLESLRKEIENLEKEVRKGVEGRKALVEELMSLSPASNAQQLPNDQDFLAMDAQVAQPMAWEEDQGKWSSESSNQETPRGPQDTDRTLSSIRKGRTTD